MVVLIILDSRATQLSGRSLVLMMEIEMEVEAEVNVEPVNL